MAVGAVGGFVQSEGGLLVPELLSRVTAASGGLSGKRDGLEGMGPTDYGLAPGERLSEAISRSWARLLPLWQQFVAARELPAHEDDPLTTLTRRQWLLPLMQELGYGRLGQADPVIIEDRSFALYARWSASPVHLLGAKVPLDRRTTGVRGAAEQAPHGLVQEVLNRSDALLWGVVSNGVVLRLLRDNASLTRQAFVEFDLEGLFNAEAFNDFATLWLTVHATRVEPRVASAPDAEDGALAPVATEADPASCWLERWRLVGITEGTRALEQLRDGVERAIVELGRGFLHPSAKNVDLHHALRDGELKPQDYYRQLLRLVYRLLFLFVTEDRDVLLDPQADPESRSRYTRFYSTAQLRRLALKRRGGEHHDRYEQLRLIMDALHRDGQPALGLPALGSFLWSPEALELLGDAHLPNHALLGAVREICSVEQDGVRREVDFRNLGSEELGSVYESLLELHPVINRDASSSDAVFSLGTAAGNERKSTGAYYTPTSLITRLLDSALDPVVSDAVDGKTPEDAERAILALKVCDPACGSGHFLVAAAGRLSRALAAARTGDREPAPDAVRHAFRDVVARCLYGIDVQPMAVELCKVSLWLEAMEPGRPLSFLDHHIVVGDSLLGTTPALIEGGVPDDAFKAITGDDGPTVTALKAQNKRERKGQEALQLGGGGIAAAAAEVRAERDAIERITGDTVTDVEEQRRRFEALRHTDAQALLRDVADAWGAVFVVPKAPGAPRITTDVVRRIGRGGLDAVEDDVADVVNELRRQYRFLHPHVAFPEVFALDDNAGDHGWSGGFDLVLGNPPWERVKLQEKEFFAVSAPHVAAAPNAAARRRLIAQLATDDPPLFAAFQAAKRAAEGASALLRSTGRFPLCGRGDVNTYAVFAELMRTLLAPDGRSGVIVPTGIATDDTTKLFFADVIERGSLVSLFDFENREAVFPGIHRSYKFCLLTLAGTARPPGTAGEFAFFATNPAHLDDPERRFPLTAEDIALVNPNTKTCPIFRTRRDAEITKGIYRRVPVLVREGDPDGNPWGIKFRTMFHMSNDSHLFRTRDQMERPPADDPLIGGPTVGGDGYAEPWRLVGNRFERGTTKAADGPRGAGDTEGALERFLPLYEAKMLHHFDSKWATYEPVDGGYATRYVTTEEKEDPEFSVMPRYWVPEKLVDSELRDGWFGYRNISNVTNERTMVGAFVERAAANHALIVVSCDPPSNLPVLSGLWSSFVFDYVARQKIGGINMTYNYVRQFAIPSPDQIGRETALEGMMAILLDKSERTTVGDREVARAKMDAEVAHSYGLSALDLVHILDSFPIVRRKDLAKHGEYRTKRLILEAFASPAIASDRVAAP